MNADEPVSNDTPLRRRVVLSACIAGFMATLDTSIVNVSLPQISRCFHLDTAATGGIIQYYQLFLAATMLLAGRFADRLPLGRLFLGGFSLFTISSAFCAMAPSGEWLMAGRSLQGIGGSVLTVTAYTLVPRHVPAGLRGKAFGWITTSAALGLTLGAPLGGFLTEALSWPWIFWINIPIGLGAVLFALKGIPATEPPAGGDRSGCFDINGAILSFTGIWMLIYALGPARKNGLLSTPVIVLLAGAVVLLGWFALRLTRVPDPLIDPALFRSRPFRSAMLAAMAAFLFLAGSSFLLPFFLETAKQLSPGRSGLTLLVYSLFYMATAPLAGRLADRLGPPAVCRSGMLSAVGACLLFAATVSVPGIWPVVLFLAWMAVSFGFFIAPNNNWIMAQSSEGHQGSAAGVYGLMTRLSMLLGVGVMETVFTSSLPAGVQTSQFASLPLSSIQHGFQVVGITGAVLCLTAFLLVQMAGRPIPSSVPFEEATVVAPR